MFQCAERIIERVQRAETRAEDAERHNALLVEQVRQIVRNQSFYPDTHTGSRQQWVKDQILEKLDDLSCIEPSAVAVSDAMVEAACAAIWMAREEATTWAEWLKHVAKHPTATLVATIDEGRRDARAALEAAQALPLEQQGEREAFEAPKSCVYNRRPSECDCEYCRKLKGEKSIDCAARAAPPLPAGADTPEAWRWRHDLPGRKLDGWAVGFKPPIVTEEMQNFVLQPLYAFPPSEPGWRPTHRHVKTGGEYMLLGIGRMQAADNWSARLRPRPNALLATVSVDMREVAIYQGMDGQYWVRPVEEWTDGRFEEIAASPSRGEPA